jgi:hypothetical protein
MRCRICGNELQETQRQIRTTNGNAVHFACAEQEATQAWKQRRLFALLHGELFGISIAVIWHIYGANQWLLVIFLAWSAIHVLLHQRWWYFTLKDLRITIAHLLYGRRR